MQAALETYFLNTPGLVFFGAINDTKTYEVYENEHDLTRFAELRELINGTVKLFQQFCGDKVYLARVGNGNIMVYAELKENLVMSMRFFRSRMGEWPWNVWGYLINPTQQIQYKVFEKTTWESFEIGLEFFLDAIMSNNYIKPHVLK